MYHLNASNWQFECQLAVTFSKIRFQNDVTTVLPCSGCDLAMSSGERGSQNLGLPYLLFYASVCYNIMSAMAGKSLMKISHQE